MQELNLSVRYKVFHSPEQLHIMEQEDSYINIIQIKGNNPLSYAIENHSYLLNAGESCIHHLPAQHNFSCNSTSDDTTTLIITLPAQDIKIALPIAMQQMLHEQRILSGGDSRIALLTSQVLDMHASPIVFNRLKIQSLLIDLLTHQLQRFYDTIRLSEPPLSKTHYEKALQAKELITTNLARNYTIPELAKEVGTNEQYLKKYFKQYFGKTIMGYMVECKMNHARNLILKSEYRVTDIARLVGYKHATHFSSAFKRHFGFIPNSLRYSFLLSIQHFSEVLIGVEWGY